jgi:predicted alpha/beta hydrolase
MAHVDYIRTRDDRSIAFMLFSPDQPNGKVVILAPSIGSVQLHYVPFANYLQEQGFTVVSFDYRGIGRSAPDRLRGYTANLHLWASQDADAVIRYVRETFCGQEIIYLGHELSGELFGLIPASQYVSQLVMVGSALTCQRLYPATSRLKIFTFKMIARTLTRGLGYFPGRLIGLLQNLPAGVLLQWTEWCNYSNGLFEPFPESRYSKLRLPILCLSYPNDWHCPDKAVFSLLRYFSGAGWKWYHVAAKKAGLDPSNHATFFESSAKERLWPWLVNWIRGEEVVPSDYFIEQKLYGKADRQQLILEGEKGRCNDQGQC